LNNSFVNEGQGTNVNINSDDKTQDINVDNDETEEILTEERNVDGIENQVQDIQPFENYDTSGTDQIKHSEKAGAHFLSNLKKIKKINSNNNNPAHQILEIMKENAASRKAKQEEKILKPKLPTVFENMDETDIFF